MSEKGVFACLFGYMGKFKITIQNACRILRPD